MTEPTPSPSKLQLLVAHTDEYNHNLNKGLSVINNTSAKITCVIDNLTSMVDDLCSR